MSSCLNHKIFCEGTIKQGMQACKILLWLKASPQVWYEKLTEHLLKLNFKHYNLDDATLFVKKVGRYIVFLMVYVDGLLMIGNTKYLKKCFEMTDLGHLHYYLGIEVTQHPKYIFISQKRYVGELLNRFCMTECNPLSTPMEQNLQLT